MSDEKVFLLTPLREGRLIINFPLPILVAHFYSRPCGRGDKTALSGKGFTFVISTHAPAGGATHKTWFARSFSGTYFYSRPCGRGDLPSSNSTVERSVFLLTPLREGRLSAGDLDAIQKLFLLTPLREGRPSGTAPSGPSQRHFYSRPCGRGDNFTPATGAFEADISTHAPAGGATAHLDPERAGGKHFYSRPCGRGDLRSPSPLRSWAYFYSRPCGRGDRRAA